MAKLGPDQQRFLVACQVEEDPRANHLWIVARLTGPIKLSSLEDAWRQIWKRNDVLRMHWGSERENSQPSFAPQEGCPTVEVSASVQDPTAWAEEVIGRRFDLSKPWSRFEIARMSEVDCILALVLPRASLDVRSLRLIFDEFVQFYGGTVEGETNPPKKGLSEYLKGNEDGPKFDPIALRQASSILAGDLPSLDLPSRRLFWQRSDNRKVPGCPRQGSPGRNLTETWPVRCGNQSDCFRLCLAAFLQSRGLHGWSSSTQGRLARNRAQRDTLCPEGEHGRHHKIGRMRALDR
jgi:hypothetical protein